MSEELKVSAASAFRRPTELLKLPGGNVVEVKEVDLVGLIIASQGEVPDFISNQILSGLNAGKAAKPKAIMIDKSNVGDMFVFVDMIVRAAVVNPVVVTEGANYDAGQINLGDLDPNDKLAIFNKVMPTEEAEAAVSFRNGVEATVVDGVPNGQNKRSSPKRRSRAKQ